MKSIKQKRFIIFLQLVLLFVLAFHTSAAESSPAVEAFIKFSKSNFENSDFWKKADYAARSIARIVPGKIQPECFSNGIDSANHPMLAAYFVIDRINAAFSLDPTDPGNLNELLEVHKLCIGSSLEHSLVIRIFYALMVSRSTIAELQLVYRYYVRLANREKSNLEIPLKKKLIELKILVEATTDENSKMELSRSWLEKHFPFPVAPRELIIYARCMHELGQADLAREACERTKKQWYFGNVLAPYPDLKKLYKEKERPVKTVPGGRVKFEFNRIFAGLFCRKASAEALEYWSNLFSILEPSGNRYYSSDSSVPADIVDTIVESLKNSPKLNGFPKFSSDRGFFIFLNRPESPNIKLIGEMGVNHELREFYAIEDQTIRLINTPDAVWAVLLFMQEAKILRFNQEGEAGKASSFDPLKEIPAKLWREENDEEKEFSEILKGGVFSREAFFLFWLPEREKAFKVTHFDWKFRLSDYRYGPYYVLGFACGNRLSIDEKQKELLDLKNSALTIIRELERFSVGKLESCSVSNLGRKIGKYYSVTENNILAGYVANKGLPDLWLLPSLLRLYSILGLELPASGPLDFPLFFRGNFRVEKDCYVYVNGYWFPRQEMLVIAEFSMDLSSEPGKKLARVFKLTDVDQKIKVKMTDSFRYTNYGLEFDSKAKLPESWSETLGKVFLAENAPGNIGRKLFFFRQKKERPSEFVVLDEPDSKF